MNIWLKGFALMTLGTVLVAPAQARPHRPDVQDRLDHQVRMIERGIESGELTKREVKVLRREQYELRDLARDLRDDGYSRHERRRILDRKLDRAEDQIRRFMHNDDRRNRQGSNNSRPRRDRYDEDGARYW